MWGRAQSDSIWERMISGFRRKRSGVARVNSTSGNTARAKAVPAPATASAVRRRRPGSPCLQRDQTSAVALRSAGSSRYAS